MDLSETTAPRSDQLNFEDFVGGPRTVTVEKVTKGSAEQPVEIHLVGYPGRPFKPSKTVRRILVAAWGKDSDVFAGRRMVLYGDPSVRFSGQEVGGIRISHLSHIDRPLSLALTVTRGKRRTWTVEPLPADAAPSVDIDTCTDIPALRAMWQSSDDATRARITARVAELSEPAAEGETA